MGSFKLDKSLIQTNFKMKLLTSLTCFVAAAKSFEAGDYIGDRYNQVVSQIYTELDDGGYDIHVGKFIHLRREGNNILNEFAWGFANTDLDTSKETISWTDDTINYNKVSKIHMNRYPFLHSFYNLPDVSIWEEETSATITFDVFASNFDIVLNHDMIKDGNKASTNVHINSGVKEMSKAKMTMETTINAKIDTGDWSESDLKNFGINYKSFDLKITPSVSTKCFNPPLFALGEGCFFSLEGTASLDDESSSIKGFYKAQQGGLFVFKAAVNDDMYTVKIIGNNKGSIIESETFEIRYRDHSANKRLSLFSGPTPWGFEDKCMGKVLAHVAPIYVFVNHLGVDVHKWLLAVIYSDKIAESIPEDLFNLSDVVQCANIKSKTMLKFFNKNARSYVNGAIEDFVDAFNEHALPSYRKVYPDAPEFFIDAIPEQKSVVDGQSAVCLLINNLVLDGIDFVSSLIASGRKTVHSITGEEGEAMFDALW